MVDSEGMKWSRRDVHQEKREQRHTAGEQLAFVCPGKRGHLNLESVHFREKSNSGNRVVFMGTQLCGEHPFAIRSHL